MRPRNTLIVGFIVVWLMSLPTTFAQETGEAVSSGRLLVKFSSEFPDWYPDLVAMAFGMPVVDGIYELQALNLETPMPGYEDLYAWMLSALPGIEYAESDLLYQPQVLLPNDPHSAMGSSGGWYLWRIGMPAAWMYTQGNPDVIIALLDTGVKARHPDLQGKLVSGWNFYNNNSNTDDVLGHGTMMAGILAANTNNGVGIASVGTRCRVMPIRISDNAGNGGLGNAARGLIWAADRGAKVALVSYSMYTSQTVRDAAQYFVSRGGIVVMPAGNSGGNNNFLDNPYVTVVSATNQQDEIASFSSRGNYLDISAPWVSIACTLPTNGYGTVTGTCPAAAVVGGVAGLLYSANPLLTSQQVEQILKSTADDLGTLGWDTTYGAGRVNAYRAVVRARGLPRDTTPPSVSFASPAQNSTVSGLVNIAVNASDNVGVRSLQASVNGQHLETRELPPYTFRWNTSRLANGAYTISATATDWEGNRRTTTCTVSVRNSADRTPPTVRILSPTNGAQVSGTVRITVSAQDDQRVTRVELYVNNQRVTLTTLPPFTLYWNTSSLPTGTYTLQCKVYDAAENVGVSAPVTVRK